MGKQISKNQLIQSNTLFVFVRVLRVKKRDHKVAPVTRESSGIHNNVQIAVHLPGGEPAYITYDTVAALKTGTGK